MLAFTTLFAVLSGILRYHEAPVTVYLFFGVLGAAVCGAQMYSNNVPRLVSIIAGAVCLPLFVFVESMRRSTGMDEALFGLPCFAVAGGLVGYLAGAVAAGVFLVSDLVEARWRGEIVTTAELVEEAAVPEGTPVYTSDSCTPYLSDEAKSVTDQPKPSDAPRVKKLGPPSEVPVFNCVALVSPRGSDGIVHARAANVSDLRTSGATEREALQHLVGAFKIIVAQSLAEGRPVPLLSHPHSPEPGEQQRLIAVHL